MALLAAIITGLATLAAAVIKFVGDERMRRTRESLAKIDDRRALTPTELEDIKVAGGQLGQQAPRSATGRARVKVVYPGQPKFRSYSKSDNGRSYDYREDVNFSGVDVSVDGDLVGGGDGERGFSTTFEAIPGRHNMLFMWTGSKQMRRYANTDTGRDSESEQNLSGRSELIFWVVRDGECVIHLDQSFALDHVEPQIVFPCCYGCRMPGVRVCKCGRKYCAEHASFWAERAVCLACKEAGVQSQLAVAKVLAVAVALVAGVAALYFWATG